MIAMIPNLIRNVSTSMSVADIVAYTKSVYGIGNEDIYVRTLSGSTLQDPVTGAWSSHYYLNKEDALADINECLNVYKTDISEEIFDAEGFFADRSSDSYIYDYYLS